ncbi:MAG: biotin--[acetyl-CoA-carboxylase] ligase [Phenylobacterium zucineum]|nr:MAG: biotin--[acetyl-CoA-carboxylase] ligase [Phenylobacterium zucineum]
MNFENSSTLASKFVYLDSTGSTNTDLVRWASGADSGDWPDFTAVVAGEQTEGKGRSGREWVSPAGSSLSVSVLLTPAALPLTAFGWFPLMAGLAMRETVAGLIGASASVKWPNDVLVGELKISGVLSELLPNLRGVVLGSGLNLTQTADELPIEAATSLAIEGATRTNSDEVLSRYLNNLRHWYQSLVEAGGDADAAGLRAAVVAACGSIGRQVRVILPGDRELVGLATNIDSTGRLIVDVNGEVVEVAAGDIVHLRHN